MARQLTLIMALLAVSFIANAQVSTNSPQTSSFNVSPASVFNNASDSAFSNLTGPALIGPGFDNSTLYVWAINRVDSNTALTVKRRSVNASTVAAISSGDTSITTTVMADSVSTTASGQGYFGFVSVSTATSNTSVTGPQNMSVTYIASNGTAATTVAITTNGDSTFTYNVQGFWYDTGVWYVVFSKYNQTGSTTVGVYLQGVTTSGSLLYTSPLSIISISDSSFSGTAGPTNATNSTSAILVYKLSTGVVSSIIITYSGSGSVGTAATLATDGNNITYSVGGIVGSISSYGVAVNKNDNSSGTMAYSTLLYFNGSTTSTMNISATTGYYAPTIGGYQYSSGFGLIEVSSIISGSTGSQVVLQNYFYNGTANGTSLSLGTYNNVPGFFVDANGALWAGYITSDSSNSNYLVQGYVGKVIAQIYSGASILTSILALVALLVTALFAF